MEPNLIRFRSTVRIFGSDPKDFGANPKAGSIYYDMPVSRNDVHLYLDDLGRFYGCLTKVPYASRLVATKFAYALECIRPGRVYDVYRCDFCEYFHIGRFRKTTLGKVIKRRDWNWAK